MIQAAMMTEGFSFAHAFSRGDDYAYSSSDDELDVAAEKAKQLREALTVWKAFAKAAKKAKKNARGPGPNSLQGFISSNYENVRQPKPTPMKPMKPMSVGRRLGGGRPSAATASGCPFLPT